MNIKRGLKRLWVVGSVLLVIGVIGMTIDTFPERPKETKLGEIYKGELPPTGFIDGRYEKKIKEVLRKVRKRINEVQKKFSKDQKETLLIPLWGLGVLIFMWGLLYTGFWVSSGFSSDKKKDETPDDTWFTTQVMNKKDINTLIKLSRILGKSICDKGTFEERQSKYLVMEWQYKGKAFTHKFPGSLKATSINHQYSQMRKNLRASGLEPPSELSAKFMGSVEQQELLEELWIHLGTDDEGETPYGGDVIDEN